jgi:hypothetical protein
MQSRRRLRPHDRKRGIAIARPAPRADAKAITRLVPRRDNRRDRDVAKGIVRKDAAAMAKALVPRCAVSAPARWPGGRRSGGSAQARALRPASPSEFGPSSAELVADARAGALGKLDDVAAQAFATALIAVAASSSQRTTHYARPGDSARRPSSAPSRSIRDSRPARRFGARRDGAPVRRSPRRAVRRNASSATPVFGAGRIGYATRPPNANLRSPRDDRADRRLNSKGYAQCSHRRSQSRASCQPASRSAS